MLVQLVLTTLQLASFMTVHVPVLAATRQRHAHLCIKREGREGDETHMQNEYTSLPDSHFVFPAFLLGFGWQISAIVSNTQEDTQARGGKMYAHAKRSRRTHARRHKDRESRVGEGNLLPLTSHKGVGLTRLIMKRKRQKGETDT